MVAYYNEIDPFAAQWLRELISANLIAPGEVDERSIKDVKPEHSRWLMGYPPAWDACGVTAMLSSRKSRRSSSKRT